MYKNAKLVEAEGSKNIKKAVFNYGENNKQK